MDFSTGSEWVCVRISSNLLSDIGLLSNTLSMYVSTSSEVLLSLSVSGFLGSVSGTTNCFPGWYSATALKRINLVSCLWHFNGVQFKSCVFISGTSGLWSVINRHEGSPVMYLSNLSQAYTADKHSFLICAYFFSASDYILEAYALGCLSPSTVWYNAALIPKLLASALTMVGLLES